MAVGASLLVPAPRMAGYVLIETEVGAARAVAEKLKELTHANVRVTDIDLVTGPFDVIAMLRAEDLSSLGSCITEAIQTVPGVRRTTTCLSIVPDSAPLRHERRPARASGGFAGVRPRRAVRHEYQTANTHRTSAPSSVARAREPGQVAADARGA